MHELMMDEHKQLTTNKFSPAIIVEGMYQPEDEITALDAAFLIPIYQRLYSWEPEHVKRLLDDLHGAFVHSKTSEYFIGAIVTTWERHQDRDVLELIDGQQRLTTLWLIASVMVTKEGLYTQSRKQWLNFLAFVDQPQQPRLDFSGREADIKALKGFVIEVDKYRSDNQQWLKNDAMASARSTIDDFLNQSELRDASQLQAFSDYIWAKATFVITQLHPQTDKERFFDTMNSRGVQLEKHEILKALMLTDLTQVQRDAYGKAWDLCADIDGYLPSSLQSSLLYGLKTLDEVAILSLLSPSSEDSKLSFMDCENTAKELTLTEILDSEFVVGKVDDKIQTKPQSHKSPVSFPVFLLHVLRVYVEASSAEFIKDKSEIAISLDDKKLVEVFELIFKSSEHQHRQHFIECLLECRLLLDNFVIKGELDGTSEHMNWQISSRQADPKEKARLKRTGNTWDSICVLQSMMHFSPMNGTQRVTWLTPTLQALRSLRYNFTDGAEYLLALQQYDQSYAQSILGDKNLSEVLGTEHSKPLGTGVHHYWFYKLEYCLWELWYNGSDCNKKLDCKRPGILGSARFRIRSINSVEHVSPQSLNNGEISEDLLDCFGNLALISVNENSTYSDKDPIEKRSIFEVRLKNGLIQSLKLAHIFSAFADRTEDWNDTVMLEHENTMVAVLQAFHPEWVAKNNNNPEADA
jgi:hypothetical protein